MREILFVILGLVVGGGGVYFFSTAKLQRQLASAEGKLKRANRATDDMDALRSQQLTQAEALQTAQAKIQSLEADYRAQVSEYQQKLQEQQASLQAYQTQIEELESRHQQEIADLQSTPIEAPPASEPSHPPSWFGAVAGGTAIAGAAGLAGAAISGLFRPDEAETPASEAEDVPEAREHLREEREERSETTTEENWVDSGDSPFGDGSVPELSPDLLADEEIAVVPDTLAETAGDETSHWQSSELSPFDQPSDQSFEQPTETLEVVSDWTEADGPIAAEDVREETPNWPVETSPFDDPFSSSLEAPMLEEEENWVDAGDAPLEDVRVEEQSLEAWSEGENSLEVPTTDELVLEEIEPVDTSMSSLELPAGFMAELPADRDPSSPLPLTEELSSESALDFLLELEGDDSPEQDSDLLAFAETNDLESGNLSDLSSELDLDSEAMPLLDLFADDPEILPEFPLTEPGQSDATPFINFLDSTAEKSDAEFLEMLQSEEEDSTMPSPLEESDDIFGDLFHNPAPPSSTEMDGLFSQNHASESPSASDSGLEELFSEDDLFFDNWDQLGTEVAVKES